jgi:hypothetical protein
VRKEEIIYFMICEGLFAVCNNVYRRVGGRVLAASTQQLLVNITMRLSVFILCLRANHSTAVCYCWWNCDWKKCMLMLLWAEDKRFVWNCLSKCEVYVCVFVCVLGSDIYLLSNFEGPWVQDCILNTHLFFSVSLQPNSDLSRFVVDVSKSRTVRCTHPVALLWLTDQLVAETVTYTTHNKQKRRKLTPSAGFETAIPAVGVAAAVFLRPHDHQNCYFSSYLVDSYCQNWF